MKKIFMLVLVTALVLFCIPIIPIANSKALNVSSVGNECLIHAFDESEVLTVSAKSSALIVAENRCVLYASNAEEKMGMASTTKIMTALIAIEELPFERICVVPSVGANIEGSSIYLTEGERITAEALIYGLLLESGNDAAATLAYEIGGSIEKFVEMMNVRAQKLGMTRTHFANPHGLSDDNHYTTSFDLALLTASALENETFLKIVSTHKAQYKSESSEMIRYYVNHNKLLSLYDGTLGVKTGYTLKTGKCLVAAAERHGIMLVAVVLNAPDSMNDCVRMFDYGFGITKRNDICYEGEYNYEVNVVGGTKQKLRLTNMTNLSTVIPDGITLEAVVSVSPFIYAPVNVSDVVGYIKFCYNGFEICSVPLCAADNIKVKRISLFKKIFG